ncbi:MAG: hypothetical protein IJF02_00800 [Oscillospiraceae bacterium]|nr:hypothetical protein [Oscillospiraceae bacterium]
MKRRKPFLLILGTCLIVFSLCCVIVVQFQQYHGAKNCQEVVMEMNKLLPDRTPGVSGAYSDSVMPVLEINGADYVALLEIPSQSVVLPVADQWNSMGLSNSPARFSGSAYDKSLVIGGVDHPRQFGFCDEIEHDAVLNITDMTGAQFSYIVSRIDRSKHAQTQWLQNEEYDLTLFCRSAYSMEYIAVRCILAYN